MTIARTRTEWINKIANTSPQNQVDVIQKLTDKQRQRIRSHVSRRMSSHGDVTWNASKILAVIDEIEG